MKLDDHFTLKQVDHSSTQWTQSLRTATLLWAQRDHDALVVHWKISAVDLFFAMFNTFPAFLVSLIFKIFMTISTTPSVFLQIDKTTSYLLDKCVPQAQEELLPTVRATACETGHGAFFDPNVRLDS